MEETRGDAGIGLGDGIAALSNRFYDAIRHPDAYKAHAAPAGSDFSLLSGHKYALLETFRANGQVVPTPIWFGLADGRVFVRTEAKVGKVKRIRANGRARLAPCNARGRPLGPAVEGTARILAPDEEPHAEAALAANYGVSRKIYESAGEKLGVDAIYIEVTPDSGGAAVAADRPGPLGPSEEEEEAE
ncbi:MAG: PPOX class F420-dependent oxidoreductase [Thermoleophilaceae bacterium]|nr:PPOX class F420-dependent oxidoreductase [Thermoleophilaceae bacterium]